MRNSSLDGTAKQRDMFSNSGGLQPVGCWQCLTTRHPGEQSPEGKHLLMSLCEYFPHGQLHFPHLTAVRSWSVGLERERGAPWALLNKSVWLTELCFCASHPSTCSWQDRSHVLRQGPQRGRNPAPQGEPLAQPASVSGKQPYKLEWVWLRGSRTWCKAAKLRQKSWQGEGDTCTHGGCGGASTHLWPVSKQAS